MSGLPLYFLSTLAYFWLPVAVLGWRLYPGLGRMERKAFWLALAAILPMTAMMEVVYLKLDIWDLSKSRDPLLGPGLFGVPIEEFSFWFGAAPFILLTYIGFDRIFPKRDRAVGDAA